MKKKRVIVAMSGGVDSAVTAFLLQNNGYDVEGITMQPLAGNKHVLRARKIAKILKIPIRVFKIQREFNKRIVDYFCDEYIAGHTPNPCLRCNRFIKFGLLMGEALKRGDYFATGHYACVNYDKTKKIYTIHKGKDTKKDQSYVLYMLNQKQLSRVLLPLGNYTKLEVRKFANKLKLPVKNSDESQDICFVKDNDHVSFIAKQARGFNLKAGDIVNLNGGVLGRHKGVIGYTIGQRKGLGIANKVPLL